MLDAGFSALVLEEPLHEESLERLRGLLPRRSVVAIRLFLPPPRWVRPGQRSPFRLGSLEAGDRRDALRAADRSFEVAEELAIPRVLLPVVGAGPSAGEARGEEGRRHRLDAFRRELDHLLSRAAGGDRRLALTLSGRPDEIPTSEDLPRLAADFAGAPLDLWLDTARWPPEGAAGASFPTAGVSIRDVLDGQPGHPPGRGDLDWEALAPRLRECPLWCVDLRSGAPPEELAEATAFLEALDERKCQEPSLFPGAGSSPRHRRDGGS